MNIKDSLNSIKKLWKSRSWSEINSEYSYVQFGICYLKNQDVIFIGEVKKKKKYFEYLLKLKILNRPIIVIFFLFSFQEKTVIIEREVLKMLKIITQLYNDYTKIYKLAQYRDETFTAYRLKKIFISGGGKLFIFH